MYGDHLIIQGWFEAAVLDVISGQRRVIGEVANTLEVGVYEGLWDAILADPPGGLAAGYLTPTSMAVSTMRSALGVSSRGRPQAEQPPSGVLGQAFVLVDLDRPVNVNNVGLFAYEGRFTAEALLHYRIPRDDEGLSEPPSIQFAGVYTNQGLFSTAPVTISVARDVGINTLLLTYKLGVGPIDRIRGALRELRGA